jgi:hypothetical protein
VELATNGLAPRDGHFSLFMIKSRFFAYVKFDLEYNSKQPWRQYLGLFIIRTEQRLSHTNETQERSEDVEMNSGDELQG